MTTPTRKILKPKSKLKDGVHNGLAALGSDKDYVEPGIRSRFADSLDVDEALREAHPQDNRWDYLMGITSTGRVVGLEPHSAKEGEVSTVIAKRKKAIEQLSPHLKTGATIRAWFWVASGKVDFLNFEKAIRRLDQNGITFVGKKLLAKHLPTD